MSSHVPDNEKERLDALASYEILDTKPEQEFDDIAILAANVFSTPMANISLVDADRIWYKSLYGSDKNEVPRDFSFCSQSILSAKPLLITDTHADKSHSQAGIVTNEPYIRFYMGVPLLSEDGNSLGALSVMDKSPKEPTDFQKEALVKLAQQVCTLLELRKARFQLDNQQLLVEVYKEQISAMNAEVSNLSRTDELSGLWNRKTLVYELGKELSRSRRSGSTFALLKLDIDDFSSLNDRRGKEYSNEVLRSLGALLIKATRDTDCCARFSGDQFIILMPNTDRSKANLVANRVRTSLKTLGELHDPVTASIGVAVVLAAQASEEDILGLAENCMQKVKDEGGNQIEIEAFYGA